MEKYLNSNVSFLNKSFLRRSLSSTQNIISAQNMDNFFFKSIHFCAEMTYKKNELVKVQLRVHKPLGDYQGGSRDYFVAVVGPGVQLGNDDPNIAPRCNPVGHNFWVKDLWLPKDSSIHYKFLVVRSRIGVVVDLENIAPRHLHVGQTPITVENTFNKIPYKKIRATHKQSRARGDQNENKGDIQRTKAKQRSTDSAIKCTTTKEKTGDDIGEYVFTKPEISEALKTQKTESIETEDVNPRPTDTLVNQEKSNGEHAHSFNIPGSVSFANSVSDEKGNHSGRSVRKRLAVVVAGVALASCLGYFVLCRK